MLQDAVDRLIALLDLEPIEVNIFRGVSPDETVQRVFGGQVAGQALVAAARTVSRRPPRRTRCTPTSCVPGDPAVPILYEVDRIRDGRSFTTRRVVAIQHGKAIFNLQASFHVPEQGLDHQVPMADVTAPPAAAHVHRAVGAVGRHPRRLVHRGRGPSTAATSTGRRPERKQVLPPYQRVWLRADGVLPDDPVLHACVAGLRVRHDAARHRAPPPRGEFDESRLMMASLDHAMWFHRPFRADEWLLYHQDTPTASDGLGLARGLIYTHDGHLAVSVVQEGLLRIPS